ncbi:MAG: DNA polymerase III subunit delta' [Syntrophus sp. (in: bacteria)]|nr:DNA polymerase III subunit delta' [Syntrophus sp. (in: bacteria)]
MGFENIIGHEKPKNLLRMFLEHKNIPHAFLFYGQEGIGKKLIAKEFIKYLFCETASACGECRPCKKIQGGNHPDLITIEGEDSIGIDQSRMLSKEIYEYPYESEKRAIILDRAERLTHEAANALLKTLEEPPPFNHFFLITSAEQEVPLTIRSRCTRVFFTPLVREQLKQFFLMKTDADEERADLLARISYGSIGCGLFWIEEEHLLLRRMIAELVAGKNRSFVNASLIAEKIAKTNSGFSIYLAFLLSLFRDMLVVKYSQDFTKIVNRDLEGVLDWQIIDIQWVENTIKRIQETMRIMRYNVNRWLVFENLLFHVMR